MSLLLFLEFLLGFGFATLSIDLDVDVMTRENKNFENFLGQAILFFLTSFLIWQMTNL
jgi:hypothetical protein